MEWHVYPRTVVSVSYHYEHPTKRQYKTDIMTMPLSVACSRHDMAESLFILPLNNNHSPQVSSISVKSMTWTAIGNSQLITLAVYPCDEWRVLSIGAWPVVGYRRWTWTLESTNLIKCGDVIGLLSIDGCFNFHK